MADVIAGRPMTWRVCDGPVALTAGTHRLVAEPTVQFEPLSLTWRPVASSAAATGDENDRLRVSSWDDARRVVSVTSGPESILRVAENVNDGWRATLDGKRLESVVLDGWQQGYVIPAGTSGDVVIEFAPDQSYRAALLVGFALALALVVLALISARRRPQATVPPADLTSPVRLLPTGVAVAVGVGALVLGGIPFAVGWAAGLLEPVRRYATWFGVIAVVVSGVLVATSPGLAGGRPGVWADGAAALGVGILVAQLVRLRRAR